MSSQNMTLLLCPVFVISSRGVLVSASFKRANKFFKKTDDVKIKSF